MNPGGSGRVALTLLALGVASVARGWEPSEPAGVTPLNAEQIKSAVAGKLGRGKSVSYEERYYENGVLQGVNPDGQPYSGKWWVEEDENFLCMKYLYYTRNCFNVARGEDGMLYYYSWGSSRPDYDSMLEAIPD